MSLQFVAYPTIGLFIIGFLLIGFAIISRLVFNYSPLYTIPISILANYILFPVIHDGSHRSISNNKFVNEPISYTAGIPFFFAPFPAWRFIHLRHHQFTNVPGDDPDYYAGGGASDISTLIFRWSTYVLHYYSYFFKSTFAILYNKIRQKTIGGRVCDVDKLKSVANDVTIQNNGYILLFTSFTMILNVYIAYFAYIRGYFSDVFILWIFPSACSIIILSILFDYLPHREYTHTIRDNKYLTTNMTHGLFSTRGDVNKVLAALTFNQLTYHNIHHLYPKLPFYEYHSKWQSEKDALLKKGIKVQSVFGHI